VHQAISVNFNFNYLCTMYGLWLIRSSPRNYFAVLCAQCIYIAAHGASANMLNEPDKISFEKAVMNIHGKLFHHSLTSLVPITTIEQGAVDVCM